MKNYNCTFLINSCDANDDIWKPFFMCLEKNWSDMSWPVVLNTESKSYKYKDYDIKTFSLFSNRKDKWSQRLRETLEKIDTEYIFFILDDFFITEPVDSGFIKKCFNWMDDNQNISVFSFHPVVDDKNIVSKEYKGFEKRPYFGEYKLNCQAAVWRRKRLIAFLKDDESPWDFEIYGSIRVGGFEDDFYVLDRDLKDPIEYNMVKGGTGLVRGKWSAKVVVPLFKELGLDVDFSKRGFINEDYFDKDERTFFEKIYHKIKRTVKKINSVLWNLKARHNGVNKIGIEK